MTLNTAEALASADAAVLPSIPQWYSGRSVLITGGSGFMGKVLIEKLLRSCPDVRTVYLLLRAKKGRAADSRIAEITQQPLFDRLRAENPQGLRRLRAVAGDVTELGLGLSAEDRDTLQREVSVVFHSAASVRFDDPLREAIIINVRGTREVINLALGMPHLQALIHFSTTFSNCEQPEVQEELYPTRYDWRFAIKMAECDAVAPTLPCLTKKVLGKKVNTYIFAKAVAETLVNDFRHQLPLVIVRPSIVASTFDEPMPGWIDNFNGPIAIWMGAYTGVLRAFYTNQDDHLDLVPVDSAIKSVIYMAWHKALVAPREEKIQVYNCSSLIMPLNFKQQIVITRQVFPKIPTSKAIWIPTQFVTDIWPFFYIYFMLVHVLPAAIVDAVLIYNGGKPKLMKIYRRAYPALVNTFVFTHIFEFKNEKFLEIEQQMLPGDRPNFGYSEMKEYNLRTVDLFMRGARVFLLNDPLETIPRARQQYQRFFWMNKAVRWTLSLLLVWAVFKWTSLQTTLSEIFGLSVIISASTRV